MYRTMIELSQLVRMKKEVVFLLRHPFAFSGLKRLPLLEVCVSVPIVNVYK